MVDSSDEDEGRDLSQQVMLVVLEKLRDTFLDPSTAEAPASDATLDLDHLLEHSALRPSA